MCTGEECSGGVVSRRSFVVGASATLAGLALPREGSRQPSPAETLADPRLLQGPVSFKCGADDMEGYLAHPKKAGRYRPVVVLHGNFGLPDVACYTAPMLAQHGFAALAVKRFGRVPGLTVEKLAESDRTDHRFLSKAYTEQELIEALAAIHYLTGQPFARPGGVGLLGYCGGGVEALWLSTLTRAVQAVVVFHAPTDFSGATERFNNPQDPKPSVMAMVDQIQVPVQGHYGAADAFCPLPDVRRFEQALWAHGTPVEIFVCPRADHAFGDFDRPRLYRPEAATLAWARAATSLRTHWKKE